ncbi:MAG: dihydroorotase [Chitinispirillia bacterium]
MKSQNKRNGQFIYSPRTAMSSILIKNGHIIDPVNGIDETINVFIKNGIIDKISKEVSYNLKPDIIIDATNLWVVPGLMDMHVHLREPGFEYKETIESGSYAAAAGGFTSIACMPNTNPVLDNESIIEYVINRAKTCPCRIYPIGSITKNLDGNEISPFALLQSKGAKAFSDDGKSVYKADIMFNALKLSKQLNVPILAHCEDQDLTNCSHLNEKSQSIKSGIQEIPAVSENVIVARDILLAESTGARLHICHISTEGSVALIRWAKDRGVNVSCETCPHYFAFADEVCHCSDTNKKMNPPLRSVKDRNAIIEGLSDGTIDVIASDHAPHSIQDKTLDFSKAPSGVIGMETMIGAAITFLINKKILSPKELVNKMSIIPNKILGLSGGSLTPQSIADVTIIDPKTKWKVNSSLFFSKSKNAIFDGMNLTGFARYTILGGKIVYERK